MSKKIKSVAIIYTHYPHYRYPVFSKLNNANEKIKYYFYFGDGFQSSKILKGKHLNNSKNINQLNFSSFYFQFINPSVLKKHDAFIFLGNPNVISTWIYAIFLRLIKKKVYFWTHGWIQNNHTLKQKLRDIFYSLSNGLLLYGDRAKKIGILRGFKSNQLTVIYNSLDLNNQLSFDLIKDANYKKYHLVLGRLTKELRLVEFLEKLVSIEFNEKILVIGDGDQKKHINIFSKQHNLDIKFLGPIYDEAKLSKIIFNAKSIISPGKAGLVVMHALIYGTPVITHNDPNNQMPEYEALLDGLDCGLFEWNNEFSIKEALRNVDSVDYKNFLYKARDKILSSYNPSKQVEIINNVIT